MKLLEVLMLFSLLVTFVQASADESIEIESTIIKATDASELSDDANDDDKICPPCKCAACNCEPCEDCPDCPDCPGQRFSFLRSPGDIAQGMDVDEDIQEANVEELKNYIDNLIHATAGSRKKRSVGYGDGYGIHVPRLADKYYYNIGGAHRRLYRYNPAYQALYALRKQFDLYGFPTLYTAHHKPYGYKYKPLAHYFYH